LPSITLAYGSCVRTAKHSAVRLLQCTILNLPSALCVGGFFLRFTCGYLLGGGGTYVYLERILGGKKTV